MPMEPEAQKVTVGEGMTLETVTTYCGSSSCPTIYRSDRGTLVVQGYAVPSELTGVELPQGELLVEIPISLLTKAAEAIV